MDEPIDTEKGCYTEHGVSGYGVAVKLTAREPRDTDWIKAMAEEMMLLIAGKCMDRGARCIGHIKSHIRTPTGTIKADTIGLGHGAYSSGRIEKPDQVLYMAINSIVQGIKEQEVKKATLDGVHEVAAGKDLEVIKEKEHTYFDEFDYLTSDEEHQRRLEEQLQMDEPDRG